MRTARIAVASSAATLAAVLSLAACAATAEPTATARPSPGIGEEVVNPITATADAASPTSPEPRVIVERGPSRPDWLGTVPASARDDWTTPDELRDRRLPPPDDRLPDPDSEAWAASIQPIPSDILPRTSWRSSCPVPLDDLRYLTMTFWGFDEKAHTGEMIVHSSVATDIVSVFKKLYAARFPIEEMRVTDDAEWDLPRTGDLNNTSAFECRAVTGTTSTWSQHSYGKAVDINPFHNPYIRGDLLEPELSEAYLDRSWKRPGMIHAGDAVVTAFADIGWGWGGSWNSLKDWQHFSANGK